MIKRSISILLSLVFIVTLGTPAAAQANPTKLEKRAAEVEKEVKELGTGQSVKVKAKLYTGTIVQGYLSQANATDFVVVDSANNQTTVQYSDVRSIGGGNLSTGAKIAIGVGLGVGAAILATLLIIRYKINE